MSADRELLELAAKAAGIELTWSTVPDMHPRTMPDYISWNPLTDDGDALRLAVKLGLYVEVDRPNQRASALPEQDEIYFSRELFGSDPYAATRRAIVRAATEIGKAMP